MARLRRERAPHFAPALGWEIVSAAEYERKSELDGLIGNAPRTQRSVRAEGRQAPRTGAQIAWGCAWLGGAAAHKRCSRCYPCGGRGRGYPMTRQRGRGRVMAGRVRDLPG